MCELEVETNHSFTGRMCAGTRAKEHSREDSIFEDPWAELLAGKSGMAAPMGDWILVPRTRFGDDFLVRKYFQDVKPCRQLVLLGAGMDTRAFRKFVRSEDKAISSPYGRSSVDGASNLVALPDLVVFEVDQPTTFDVKENLLEASGSSNLLANGMDCDASPLTVRARNVVPIDFNDTTKNWVQELLKSGFEPDVPTVWLLEGLVYYLPQEVVKTLFQEISQLSASGSGVFHDAVSVSMLADGRGPAPGGAPFISASDDYAGMWRASGHLSAAPANSAPSEFASKQNSTFDTVQVRNFASINVDRKRRCLWKAPFDASHDTHGPACAFPNFCRGRAICLFVTAEKSVAV